MFPLNRYRLIAIASVAIASFLFISAFVITFLIFVARHFISTHSSRNIPLSFYAEPQTRTQQASTSLHGHALRSVAGIAASLRMKLPESHLNLESSVFQVSTFLNAAVYSEDGNTSDICVAKQRAIASMSFRSPTHRAVRAVVLMVPLIFGLVQEYQSIDVCAMRYMTKGQSHNFSTMRVVVHSDQLQISSALLTLHITRRSLWEVLNSGGTLTHLMLVSCCVWFALLMLAALSAGSFLCLRMFISEHWGVKSSDSGRRR